MISGNLILIGKDTRKQSCLKTFLQSFHGRTEETTKYHIQDSVSLLRFDWSTCWVQVRCLSV